jgi:hypothetical protein
MPAALSITSGRAVKFGRDTPFSPGPAHDEQPCLAVAGRRLFLNFAGGDRYSVDAFPVTQAGGLLCL